jgi:Cu(I)/Ag(I) efflux system membrane protein CusA/SilA
MGVDLRNFFQVGPINMSVAVWVGFIALLGIATDDGVVMTTYLTQRFQRSGPLEGRAQVRELVVSAAERRIRPALMTTATTVLALLPVVASQGRGADLMAPMAIPSLGGMAIAVVTLFVVPLLYSVVEEFKLRRQSGTTKPPAT